MTDAIRESNGVTATLGQSSTDSAATEPIEINPVTGKLLLHLTDGSTSVVVPKDDAVRDDNHVTVAMGEDSTDSTKLTPLRINPSTGLVLMDIL